MKKYILTALLVGALLVSPVFATVCEEGYHWQESIVDGYYTNGDCTSWSESVCETSHEECIVSHDECGTGYWWYGWHCTSWETVCDTYETVCDEYSEAECLEYEQIWHEPTDDGQCVIDEPTETAEDPEEPVVDEPKVCQKSQGGPSWLNFRTHISEYNWNVNGKCISFMSSHFGYGGLLVDTASREYALDTFHQLLPVRDDSIISLDPVSIKGANDNYGYAYNYLGYVYGTYHTVCLSLPAGDYYVRPYLTDFSNEWFFFQENGTVYGSEYYIAIR